MLHFNKIIIKNFRPYFGLQEFNFGTKDGISIVLGDNGIGKSSLIRAIKFVLYDEFEGEGNFKIKNEINRVAWEEENFELYVALDFLYNSDHYVLKRIKRIKSGLYGIPNSDTDFESIVTLIQNDIMLSNSVTEKILKNIIPKEISEYILFEGETINKYKDLLDKKKNLEIYNSIKKILGVTILENSKLDLERQLEIYKNQQIKLIREQLKNKDLQKKLDKSKEELIWFEREKNQAETSLESTLNEKAKNENILNNNQRIRHLLEEKNNHKIKLQFLHKDIASKKDQVKEWLKDYKIYCYPFIETEINNIPNDIKELRSAYQKNQVLDEDIKNLKKIIHSSECSYCGHAISSNEINDIEKRIDLKVVEKIKITDEQYLSLEEYNRKIDELRMIISEVENKNFKVEIQNLESEIQTKLIEKDLTNDRINDINNQIDELGGAGNIMEIAAAYSKTEKNEDLLRNNINDCNEKIQQLKNRINSIMKKFVSASNTNLHNKIEKISVLIEIFTKSINEYSESMRKKVQKDATIMFKKISEKKDYDHLEFDEFYGLKLIDSNNREVPNVSSGYMTLITLSLIYGLHNNSSLTGTIILDAPFSVLTNFHRDKIIQTFQSLSPQVLLLVYRDQIDLESLRKIMQGKLINEYEIYQNRNEANDIYKTNIREIS